TAAALGTRIIEKHFTINRNDPGPDHAASLEPDALKSMINAIRDARALKKATLIQEALGTGIKRCQPCEENVRLVARRSVVLKQDAPAGTVLTEEMLAIKRPGSGIAPKFYGEVIGKTLNRDLAGDTPINPEYLSPPLRIA
ncbi:MAG: N-acetylneuraminate synthase, partial [Candidatus Peregrinibacteria bacterium Greene0416_62]